MKYIFSIGLIFLIAACDISHAPAPPATGGDVTKLEAAKAIQLEPNGLMGDIFRVGSDYTDLQRENKLSEITGKVIEWSLPVYEVNRQGNGYRVQSSTRNGYVGAFIEVIPRSDLDHKIISKIKSGDMVRIRGVISGSLMRHLKISPAIILPSVEDRWHFDDQWRYEALSNAINTVRIRSNRSLKLSEMDLDLLSYYGDEELDRLKHSPTVLSATETILGNRFQIFSDSLKSHFTAKRTDEHIFGYTSIGGVNPKYDAVFSIDLQTGNVDIGEYSPEAGFIFYGATPYSATHLQQWYISLVKAIASQKHGSERGAVSEVKLIENYACGVTNTGNLFVHLDDFLLFEGESSDMEKSNGLIHSLCKK